MTALPVGVLEELDGGPIRQRPGPSRAVAWPRAMAAASVVVISRPRLWVFALLAFLARGGLVALVVPMLVLPTFIGLANTVGPTSVTAAGPTPRLIVIIATWLGVALGAIVSGTLIAAAAEVALHRATVVGWAGRVGSGSPSRLIAVAPSAYRGTARGTALRVATVRLVLLLPVAIALAVAVPAWVQVAYRELLLPTDLAVPLPVRVIAGAPLPAAVVVGAWLATEVLGGLAARRIALHGSSAVPALRAAVGDVARAPVSVFLTLTLAIGGTLLILVPAVVVVGVAWDHSRIALVDGTDAASVILSTLVLVAAWAGCLAVAGIAAAWRSVLWTAEQARRAQLVEGAGAVLRRATFAAQGLDTPRGSVGVTGGASRDGCYTAPQRGGDRTPPRRDEPPHG